MPLRDPFRGWLPREMQWPSFACAWATSTAFGLNEILPEGLRAAPDVRRGTEVFHDGPHWTSGQAPAVIPFHLRGKSAEVLVSGDRDRRYIAGALLFVGDNDMNNPAARAAFTARCETYLREGAGLVILDAVTTHSENLHDELMARMGLPVRVRGEPLYCTAYRSVRDATGDRLEVWQEPLALGAPLPTMPLGLLYGPCVPVHFEPTYEEVFRKMRLPTEGPD